MSHFITDLIQEKYEKREVANKILEAPLISYLMKKTASVGGSSKTRGSFANLYAIYVLVEDYIQNGFLDNRKNYSSYEGADFSRLLKRQRELPFGAKLQNHALNHRCNEEFAKFFPGEELPIQRDVVNTKKYKINDKLLKVNEINIAEAIIKIVDKYVELKLEGFQVFFNECEKQAIAYQEKPDQAVHFIRSLLKPDIDARIFEVLAYCLVKYQYEEKTVYIGSSPTNVSAQPLTVYKTGRTNANDGGIDFIMKPLGRVFQVTEDLNFKKYFLDIDKLNKYPITFVVKTVLSEQEVMKKIRENAKEEYGKNKKLFEVYMSSFEEIITISTLEAYLTNIIAANKLGALLEELVVQCKVEYNIDEQ